MSGEVEYNVCDVCGKENSVQRKYYYYPIKCSCCNNRDSYHFEMVKYCSDCTCEPPYRISVVIKPLTI